MVGGHKQGGTRGFEVVITVSESTGSVSGHDS